MIKTFYEPELYHHGIKGQKWGVRRFQNTDGSLTARGKKHRNGEPEGTTEKKGSKLKRALKIGGAVAGAGTVGLAAFDAASTPHPPKNARSLADTTTSKQKRANEKRVTKEMRLAKTTVDEASKAVNRARTENAKNIKKTVKQERLDLSKMSDQELRNRINREQLERQYNQMFNPDKVVVDKGAERVDTVLARVGTGLVITASALEIAIKIMDLRKG